MKFLILSIIHLINASYYLTDDFDHLDDSSANPLNPPPKPPRLATGKERDDLYPKQEDTDTTSSTTPQVTVAPTQPTGIKDLEIEDAESESADLVDAQGEIRLPVASALQKVGSEGNGVGKGDEDGDGKGDEDGEVSTSPPAQKDLGSKAVVTPLKSSISQEDLANQSYGKIIDLNLNQAHRFLQTKENEYYSNLNKIPDHFNEKRKQYCIEIKEKMKQAIQEAKSLIEQNQNKADSLVKQSNSLFDRTSQRIQEEYPDYYLSDDWARFQIRSPIQFQDLNIDRFIQENSNLNSTSCEFKK